MKRKYIASKFLVGGGLLALGGAAIAAVVVERFDPIPGDATLAQGTYQHPAGGTVLTLGGGLGSGAFRGQGDVHDTFWTVSDRGPNIACDETTAVLGLASAVACPADATVGVAAGAGRIYARPGYSPSIHKVRLRPDNTFEILDVIRLVGDDGVRITGLPNPHVTASREFGRDGTGAVLPHDASAIDAEAIVRVPMMGGRFFIAEENAPSLVEVTNAGHILRRFVPAGTETEYTQPAAPAAAARYEVVGGLPGILAKRRLNRGLESLAVSRDHRRLYFMLQSPLDNPGTSARDSRQIRVFKARLHVGPRGSDFTIEKEWVYRIETAAFFQGLGATDAGRNRDLRVSEMLHLGDDRFLVVERTDQVTALFQVDFAAATDILGGVYDQLATVPSLELLADPAAMGINPGVKSLVTVASSNVGASPRYPQKIEALSFARDGRLLLLNDDDFGITGQASQFVLVDGSGL